MTGWSALLGGLGAVALGFGILTAILAIFQPVMDFGWVLANLLVGVLLLGGAVASSLDSLRERMDSGEARRVGRYGGSALVGTVSGVAILCGIAFLCTRHSQRFDWTEQKINTLSEQSLDLLQRLDRDVQMTAFFNAADAPPVRDLLDRYDYGSDRVSLEFVDPNRRPDLVEALGLDGEALARGFVRIAQGEAHLDLDQFSESEVTNAILKLISGEGRKIYFIEGHNERSLEDERGEGAKGYSQAALALANETYTVESLLLASVGDVPMDADAVVLAGPTRPLLDAEHEVLNRYLGRGGAMMVMLDPRANTDVAAALVAWGIEVGEDVIFDAKLALFGQASSPFSGRYENHPITAKMRDTVLFHLARSVRVREGGAAQLSEIVFTGEESWAERNLQEWTATGKAEYDLDDLIGPVPILVAGTLPVAQEEAESGDDQSDPSAKDARIVVVGDSDFATNELIANYQNRDLFVNSVNWLVDDTDQIAIRPPVSRASRFKMTGEQFMRIQYLSLFVVPEAIAVVGVVSWWMRRKRPVR